MKHTFEIKPEGIAVSFEGAMTEGVQLTLNEVSGRLPNKPARIRFDMRGVTHVNSIGIREWLTFIRGIELKHTMTFAECPASFMGFALMVPGIVGKGRVESFASVYRCHTCRTTTQVSLVGDEVRTKGLSTQTCAACGSEMESQISDGADLQQMLRDPSSSPRS